VLATPIVSRRPRDAPLVWLALSGAAGLLERAAGGPKRDGGAELELKGVADVPSRDVEGV